MSNRIVVDPITRIEGHLRIEAEIKDGKIVDAFSSGTMVRGFELILQGRDPRDAWAFTERACGVCTTVHALASVRSVEDALGITVPPTAELVRNLMFCAQYMQDHVVHFYHLHALDWVDIVSALKADPKATSELAQKMMTDKAFAQQFAQMSEAEQHAYIAKLLADKGLKPAHGTPDANAAAPMPGTDMDWMTPCNEFMQPTFAMERWQKQVDLQQKYGIQHDAVRAWTEAEIKKLPMISFGEYGHDHDPEQVKVIKKQGLDKHRTVADAMMKDAAAMFAGFRQEAKTRCAPLNDALQKVGYGENYHFGLNYTLVLQTQTMMLGDVHTLLNNEMNMIEEVARWEHEWRNFQ